MKTTSPNYYYVPKDQIDANHENGWMDGWMKQSNSKQNIEISSIVFILQLLIDIVGFW